MQIKTITKHHYKPTRMVKIKKTDSQAEVRAWDAWAL